MCCGPSLWNTNAYYLNKLASGDLVPFYTYRRSLNHHHLKCNVQNRNCHTDSEAICTYMTCRSRRVKVNNFALYPGVTSLFHGSSSQSVEDLSSSSLLGR